MTKEVFRDFEDDSRKYEDTLNNKECLERTCQPTLTFRQCQPPLWLTYSSPTSIASTHSPPPGNSFRRHRRHSCFRVDLQSHEAREEPWMCKGEEEWG